MSGQLSAHALGQCGGLYAGADVALKLRISRVSRGLGRKEAAPWLLQSVKMSASGECGTGGGRREWCHVPAPPESTTAGLGLRARKAVLWRRERVVAAMACVAGAGAGEGAGEGFGESVGEGRGGEREREEGERTGERGWERFFRFVQPQESAAVGEGAGADSGRAWIFRALRLVAIALVVAACLRPAIAQAHVGHHKVALSVGEGASHSLSDSSLFASAWAGLLAGLVHTLSGPDHLAALAPLSIGRTRLQSAAIGALWGCGHDVGQVLFGAIFVIFRDRLHLDLIRTWGSRVVGLTLITIGAMGFYESQHQHITCSPDDAECLAQPGAVVFASDQQAFSLATFATGIVHGLQPDALLVILPALAFPSKVAGGAFLVMFLLGTVLAMGTYTAFIGSCSSALHKRVPWLTHRLSLFASLIAITVGVGILCSAYFGISIFG